MITILPADEAFLREIKAPAGVQALVLRDNEGCVLGHALFSMQPEGVELLAVQSEEALLMDGLIRAVLNAGECRGALVGFSRQENLAPVLKRLEFVKTDDIWRVSIPEFFHGGCCSEERKDLPNI